MTTVISGCRTGRCAKPPVRAKKDVRLFFALWPDAALRERLHAAANALELTPGARRVPRANLHLTLHFVGNVYFDEMACMRRQARRLECAAFELEIDHQGMFDKPAVGWLGCSAVPDALGELQHRLGTRLQGCGFKPEARPYHPHITIARGLRSIDTNAAIDPIPWALSEFALVEVQSVENGVQYRVVETYPLT